MESTQSKKRMGIYVAIVLVLLAAAVAGWRHHRYQNRTLDAWSTTLLSSSTELSNIVPNYIYVAKKLALAEHELMSDVVRTRVALNEQIAASTQDLAPDVIAHSQTLIKLNSELAEKLETSATAAKDKNLEHIQALRQQWKLRIEAFEKAQAAPRN